VRCSCSVALLALLFWLGLIGYAIGGGVFTVAQSELALVYRFGKFVRVAPPGMHFAWPPPFERIVRIPTETLRMPVGFSFNDRIRNLLPTETESQWLTGDTNIVELQAIVNYSLQDPRKSLATLNELEPGPTAAQLGLRSFVIRIAVETAFSELASGMTIDELISGGKTQLQLDALARAQAFLDRLDSGILLTQVNITDANPPVAARESFTDVQSAKAERERRISEADGERRKALPDAQAEAERPDAERREVRVGDAVRSERRSEALHDAAGRSVEEPRAREAPAVARRHGAHPREGREDLLRTGARRHERARLAREVSDAPRWCVTHSPTKRGRRRRKPRPRAGSRRARSVATVTRCAARGCRRWCHGGRAATASSRRTSSTGTRGSPAASPACSSSKPRAFATSRVGRCSVRVTTASSMG
jgi:membrane protease subunit HflK